MIKKSEVKSWISMPKAFKRAIAHTWKCQSDFYVLMKTWSVHKNRSDLTLSDGCNSSFESFWHADSGFHFRFLDHLLWRLMIVLIDVPHAFSSHPPNTYGRTPKMSLSLMSLCSTGSGAAGQRGSHYSAHMCVWSSDHAYKYVCSFF